MIALARALDAAGIPHAFGGALALAYYAVPRATHDIDVNVFVPAERAGPVLQVLADLGVAASGEAAQREIAKRGQTRLRWDGTPLDLFFSYDALHESAMQRRRRVPFGDDAALEVLAAEDLAIFKTLFDRPKDWSDLRELLFAQGEAFDADYALGWLRRILAPDDERLRRFRELAAASG